MRRRLATSVVRILGAAWIVPSAGCALLGLGEVPCETAANCPADQHCSDEGVCVAGAASDAGAVDATSDARALDTGAADTSAADRRGDDAASADAAGGVDAGPAVTCLSPPCVPMPDSRTVFCRLGDSGGPDPCPAPGAALYGQDGCYTHPRPLYRELGVGQGVVEDARTGLQWEQLPPDQTSSLAAARTRCEALSLAGLDDWRLPTLAELVSLLDHGTDASAASLDPGFFPAPSRTAVWSADGYNGYHWTISLYSGLPHIDLDSLDDFGARCVRGVGGWQGDLVFSAGAYVDRRSGLWWQAQHATQQTLAQALAGCEGLVEAGHDDWRLPSIKELETLVARHAALDPQTHPAIAADTAPSSYWSSTPAAGQSGFRTISFYGGEYSQSLGAATLHARCVRGP